jgi:hypothetical protein
MSLPGNWMKNDTNHDCARSQFTNLRIRLEFALARSGETLVDWVSLRSSGGWSFCGSLLLDLFDFGRAREFSGIPCR